MARNPAPAPAPKSTPHAHATEDADTEPAAEAADTEVAAEPDDPEPVLEHANAFVTLTIDEKVKHLHARVEWMSRQLAKHATRPA